MNHIDIFRMMEQWAPKELAYEWDPVGLQIGSYTDQTKTVLVTLDVTNEVVDEAIRSQANLIIAHHPLLFTSINRLDVQSPKGKVIQKLIKHDITVYAAHTNLDIAKGGVNDVLADALRLQNKQVLVPVETEKLYKLVVYVPKDYVQNVREALGNAGAGHIGEYSHCTFQTDGTGTFKPSADSTPFMGKKNELTFVAEQKVETIVKDKDLSAVLGAMESAHPYEEVAYDLFQLVQAGETMGLGRVGELPAAQTLAQFCETVKDAFGIQHLRFVGNQKQSIRTVAVLGGSGEKFISEALNKKADVYITGDLNFHQAQDALESGMALIDPGHYVEQMMKSATKNYLIENGITTDVVLSITNTDPFQFM